VNQISNFLNRLGTIRGLQIFQALRLSSILLVGIFFAKGNLSLSDIGGYESIMFLSSLVSFFWVSAILNGLISKYQTIKEEEKKKYIFNVSILISIINLFIVCLLFLFEQQVNKGINNDDTELFNLALLYILLNNPTYLIEYFFIITDRTKRLVQYGFTNFSLNLIAVLIPIALGFGIKYALAGLIITAFIRIIVLMNILHQHTIKKFDYRMIREHLVYSLPLIISLLLSGSSEYIDSFLISSHFGPDQFALFRYGAKELPIAVLLANALSTAIVPRLGNKEQIKNRLVELKIESAKLMNLLFPLSIVLLLTSYWIYPLIFRQEFIESAKIFNVYILLLISRMIFPQSVVLALQKTKVIFKVALIEIIVNVTVSYLLMLEFGLIGVAYGTVIAFLVDKLLLSIYLGRAGIKFSQYVPLKLWAWYSVSLAIVYLFVENFI
jgi:O-antigen/teichoic acid export membrane protein